MSFSFSCPVFSARVVYSQALQLEETGTDRVYFTYRDRLLLSFGGFSDFIFYGAPDAHDYEQGADWAADHGMNHVRPVRGVADSREASIEGGALEVQLPSFTDDLAVHVYRVE